MPDMLPANEAETLSNPPTAPNTLVWNRFLRLYQLESNPKNSATPTYPSFLPKIIALQLAREELRNHYNSGGIGSMDSR